MSRYELVNSHESSVESSSDLIYIYIYLIGDRWILLSTV